MALQCQIRKLLCQFFAQAIYVLAKTNLWKLKFWPFSPGSIKLAQFFLGWIGNQESVFPQTFDGPSVSQHETPATVFGWTNVPFRQNNPIKFEISTFWLAGTKLGEFFSGLNWKPGVSFTPNFLWAFQCHKMKLLPQFLVEPMYLSEKTKRWAMEIWAKSELWFPIQPTRK